MILTDWMSIRQIIKDTDSKCLFLLSKRLGAIGAHFLSWEAGTLSVKSYLRLTAKKKKTKKKKRCFDQEGFPCLGVDGSCKVELNIRSEKKNCGQDNRPSSIVIHSPRMCCACVMSV